MYYFTMNGVQCSCNTLGELRAAVVAMPVDGRKPAMFVASDESGPHDTWMSWTGDKGEELSVALKHLEKADKKKKRKKRGYTLVEKSTSEIKKLPLIDGPITWDVVHKTAKKLGVLGTTNMTQLRSDLFARQKLG
jgi:hypothetical protein